MGQMFTVSFEAQASGAAVDFFAILAPSTRAVVLHSLQIGQTSEAGDSAAELVRMRIGRYTGADGSGGATPTPAALFGGATALSTAHTFNTTQAATKSVIEVVTFNIQAGAFYVPTPEERIEVAPSGKLFADLAAAPNDSITWSGKATFEEVGG